MQAPQAPDHAATQPFDPRCPGPTPCVRLRVSVRRHETHATFQLWPTLFRWRRLRRPAAAAAFAPVPAAVAVAVAVAVAAPPAAVPPVVASHEQNSRRSPGPRDRCAAPAWR